MPKQRSFVKENRTRGRQRTQVSSTEVFFVSRWGLILRRLRRRQTNTWLVGSHALLEQPRTALKDDIAGVDLEEAGEKWRAGDAIKSARFFLKAIENYDTALRKFPNSFDIAYNRARVQYQITQHPTIAAQLPDSLPDLLRSALESHRRALHLQQENADALFNTAQVLTSLAEALTEGSRSSPERRAEGLKLLEEAIELFQRCLTVQEFQYSESQAQGEMVDSDHNVPNDEAPMDESASACTSKAREEEQWASIVEPVTKDSLLDTALAQLETLTILCGLITSESGSGLAWIEEYSTNLLREKVSAYTEGVDRQREVALARASFICALSDTSFRTTRITLYTYMQELGSAFSEALDLSDTAEGLCTKADAFIAFNSAIAETITSITTSEQINLPQVTSLRWKALTTALDCLTAASKLRNEPKIHIARGDVELLRYHLGESPNDLELARKNTSTLLKNAQVYYRGANTLAKSNSSCMEEERESILKETAAAFLAKQDLDGLHQWIKTSSVEHRVVLEEMEADGLIRAEALGTL
ncbi:MAG: hypothetical protein M1827_000957 [Pycnora praestabilis]|nr:MAG: hypothetical protein M1827_000957 [Pycnora praestabilis]